MDTNSAMLHSCLEQEAKGNAFVMDTGLLGTWLGCYCLDWPLARPAASTLAKTAVGLLLTNEAQTLGFVCSFIYKTVF